MAPFKTFVPRWSTFSDIEDILHFKLLGTEVIPVDGPPGPEPPVGGLALPPMILSGM